MSGEMISPSLLSRCVLQVFYGIGIDFEWLTENWLIFVKTGQPEIQTDFYIVMVKSFPDRGAYQATGP